MVVPYLAHAVLATPARAFVPSCPGVWQTLYDVSSFTIRLHRFFGIIYLNDCHDRVTVIVSSASSRTLVHDALPCIHDHSTAPHACPTARLPRHHRLLNFGYIDHVNFMHGFIYHGSITPFALATSSDIIKIESSLVGVDVAMMWSTAANGDSHRTKKLRQQLTRGV
uniref:Uncharacterized protein n=1 Tax=Oryza nivara TaxID=4536 RepID=A0A0E0GZJ1_ORYNI